MHGQEFRFAVAYVFCDAGGAAAAERSLCLICAGGNLLFGTDDGGNWRSARAPTDAALRTVYFRQTAAATQEMRALSCLHRMAVGPEAKIQLPTTENLIAIHLAGERR